MTEKERFISTLKGIPVSGRVPHFEMVFFLTMEVLGKVHPCHRDYSQWGQMSQREKTLQIEDIASCYIDIAKKYGHSAIFVQTWPKEVQMCVDITKAIKERTGDEYFVMLHGDGTFGIPNGENIEDYIAQFYEEPERMHVAAKKSIDEMTSSISTILDKGGAIDGVALCSDYCFNTGPFFSPLMFEEFVAPYLAQEIEQYKRMGLFTMKHTDGNIMPILKHLIDAAPDALHSLDPQGDVSLTEVKRLYGDKICLIGNVNCGLLQTGTEQEVIDDVRRSLREGNSDGKRYIFSTSNCVFTGLELERYELMNKIWLEEG